MKSQHWQNFTPSASEIRFFQGGIRGWNEPHDVNNSANSVIDIKEINSNSSLFGAMSYELRVSNTHGGWHHMGMMYTIRAGVTYNRGLIKSSCEPGVYQMLLHFERPVPKIGPLASEIENVGLGGTFLTFVHGYGANPEEDPKRDLFVFRPTLVDPTNVNNHFELWDSNAYQGDQIPGYGINMPHVNNPY